MTCPPARLIHGSAISLFIVLLAACASPGPPRPPTLNLPATPTDLTAERIGNEVHLHWTSPTNTTDGLPLRGSLTATLCRAVLQPGLPETCRPLLRHSAQPGPSELIDPLPTSLTQAPPQLLLYRLQLLNRSEHAAAPTAPAYAAAGPAPQPIAAFTAESAHGGTLLRWRSEAPAATIEIRRTATTSPDERTPPEVLLRTQPPAQADPLTTDPGGTLDLTAIPGTRYTYTAQRLSLLTLAGHALELRSVPGPIATLDLRDTFPPNAPDALEAVADTTNPAGPAIDLSWHPNIEPDFAGYLVFRQEPGQPPQQLTANLLQAPGFRDPTALPTHTYAYTILALDKTGNRSTPSQSATARLP